jgi:hypothetical protein
MIVDQSAEHHRSHHGRRQAERLIADFARSPLRVNLALHQDE